MPDEFAKNGVPPLKMLCNLVVMRRKAINEDFIFIQSAINDDNTPDFHGFCTKQAREAGQSKKFKTNVMFRPLINKPLSDPSTILTAIYEVERITKEAEIHNIHS